MPKPETVSSAKPEIRFFRGAKASDVGYGDRGSRA